MSICASHFSCESYPASNYVVAEENDKNYLVISNFFVIMARILIVVGCIFPCLKKYGMNLLEKNVFPYSNLTGKSIDILFHSDSFDLKRNIAFGKDIIKEVRNKILYSDNFIQRSNRLKLCQNQEDFNSAVYTIEELVKKARILGCFLARMTTDRNTRIMHHAEAAKKYMAGNCHEMAAVGFQYASECNYQEIEIFEIGNGDHTFLVLGRSPLSDPHHPESWGPDAVVCDPWSGACYPAAKIKDHLRDYIDVDVVGNQAYTYVTPFDEKRQTLELLCESWKKKHLADLSFLA